MSGRQGTLFPPLPRKQRRTHATDVTPVTNVTYATARRLSPQRYPANALIASSSVLQVTMRTRRR